MSKKPYKNDFIHHHHRRKLNHDYRAPWIYHITVSKAPEAPAFSSLVIENLTPDGVSLNLHPLGKIIRNHLWVFQRRVPKVRILQYAIMPDHIHFLVQVISRLDRHLSHYMNGLKTGITNKWQLNYGDSSLPVFTAGFNDRIMYSHRSLDVVFRYIRQNPYRLAVRQMRPDFFQRSRNIFVNGREMQAYGNLFLFRNPFKISLVVHRADTEADFNIKLDECLYYAANGGVVVSAFISPREKEIRREIESVGGRIILVHDRPLGEREKPLEHDFGLCVEGRLLLVSPLDYLAKPRAEHPSRSRCLDMNGLAAAIAAGTE